MSAVRKAHNCLQHSVKAQREREWGGPASPPRNGGEKLRDFRDRIQRLADEDWDAIESEVDPVRHARRTYESMTPERRERAGEGDYL